MNKVYQEAKKCFSSGDIDGGVEKAFPVLNKAIEEGGIFSFENILFLKWMIKSKTCQDASIKILKKVHNGFDRKLHGGKNIVHLISMLKNEERAIFLLNSLVENGITVSQESCFEESPIILACDVKSPSYLVVKKLLDMGFSPFQKHKTSKFGAWITEGQAWMFLFDYTVPTKKWNKIATMVIECVNENRSEIVYECVGDQDKPNAWFAQDADKDRYTFPKRLKKALREHASAFGSEMKFWKALEILGEKECDDVFDEISKRWGGGLVVCGFSWLKKRIDVGDEFGLEIQSRLVESWFDHKNLSGKNHYLKNAVGVFYTESNRCKGLRFALKEMLKMGGFKNKKIESMEMEIGYKICFLSGYISKKHVESLFKGRDFKYLDYLEHNLSVNLVTPKDEVYGINQSSKNLVQMYLKNEEKRNLDISGINNFYRLGPLIFELIENNLLDKHAALAKVNFEIGQFNPDMDMLVGLSARTISKEFKDGAMKLKDDLEAICLKDGVLVLKRGLMSKSL